MGLSVRYPRAARVVAVAGVVLPAAGLAVLIAAGRLREPSRPPSPSSTAAARAGSWNVPRAADRSTNASRTGAPSAATGPDGSDQSVGQAAAAVTPVPDVTVEPPQAAAAVAPVPEVTVDPSEAATAASGAGSGCYESPTLPSDEEGPVRRTVGRPADWIAAYDGLGVPERKPPPRLVFPSDVGAVAGVIAYARDGGIYVLDLAASKELRLTDGYGPRFFHDGLRLAFLRSVGGAAARLYEVVLATGAVRPLSASICEYGGIGYTISPADDTIAYVSTRRGGPPLPVDLHVLDLARSTERLIETDGTGEGAPAFSPRGDEVYLVSGPFASRSIDAVTVADGTVRTMSFEDKLLVEGPAWLGDRLLFAAGPTEAHCCLQSALFTSDPHGGDVRPLGSFEVPGFMTPHPSPSARRIAASWSVREGGAGASWRSDITVMTADGTAPRTIADAFPRPFYAAFGPEWAPDDRHVAFTLVLCPYRRCQPRIESVVVVDTLATHSRVAFVAVGDRPVWRPRAARREG